MLKTVRWYLPLAVLAAAGPTYAEQRPAPCNTLRTNTDPVIHARLDHLVVSGQKVNVLVPPAYRTGTRSYPLVYLFHGAFGDQDQFTALTDLIAFTGALPDEQQAIIVMPDGTHLHAASDWHDGSRLQETEFLNTLMPFIDGTYRTRAERAYRAAAGFSGGGMNAMLYTARHPDLFVAAASFSGFVDQSTVRGIAVVNAFMAADNATCGESHALNAMWGDPILHPIGWAGHNPTDLAPNLGGHSLYIASGNGVACSGDSDPQPIATGLVSENAVLEMSQNLDAALSSAGVPHVTDLYGCGLHTYKYVQRGLHAWWPQMVAAFGTPPPTRFDYRTIERTTDVYGWHIATDPMRAPEFVDLRGVSPTGFQARGSGRMQIVTGPLFSSGAVVDIRINNVPSVATADTSGRLHLTIDLGPPHAHEEGTALAITAAALNPNYWRTATVTLSPR